MIRKFLKTTLSLIGILVISFLWTGCREKEEKKNPATFQKSDNVLTDVEIKEGWKLLFDGKTFNGWRGLGRNDVQSELWKIEDGTIHKINNGEVASQPDGQPIEGGDLMTKKTFYNYELYFEWKILKAGNTGLKYNVSEGLSQRYNSKYAALGFEYQLLDDLDTLYAGRLKPSQYTGSLYDMIPPKNAKTNSVGHFNSSRILINGNHAEHWLNGLKVLEYEFGSENLDSLYQISKYRDYPNFLEKRKGHIILQNHKDDAWFQNIKIREIFPGSQL